MHATFPVHLILFDLITLLIYTGEVQTLLNSLVHNFSPHFCYFFSLKS
jgi:hypothetical protein